MDNFLPLLMLAAALILSPFLLGLINRIKSIAAGRKGPPLAQPYRDLRRLLAKSPVYSKTAGWLFRAGPVAALAGALVAAILTPMGAGWAALSFPGDFLVWTGAFTMGRVMLILAALDVGSSFEGMGASREAWYGALAEPALFLAMAAFAFISDGYSLSWFFLSLTPAVTAKHFMAMLFAGMALFLVILAENSRIPVDDPNTHLELTMIHEVMILDHSGPDLAMLEYAAALKLWVMGSLAVGAVVPVGVYHPALDAALFLAGMIVFAVLIGLVESGMARLKLIRVPQFLTGAAVLSAIALALVARNA